MSDLPNLDAARAALAVHDHHPREVCPECCEDVCDPCVDALRWALAEVDRLTAELAEARAMGRREGLEEAAGVCRQKADDLPRSGNPVALMVAQSCYDGATATILNLAAKVTP